MASIAPLASQLPSPPPPPPSRPEYNFPPDRWRDRVASLSFSQDKLEWYDREVEMLKSKVEAMLKDHSRDAMETIKLIDILCRLGISYHFEDEYKRQLHQISKTQMDLLEKNDYDIYTVAVVFRVFRQHGIKMSKRKFKDANKNGKFKDSLANDLKGLLSLFEAAHLLVHGEEILEEALTFTRTRLQLLAADQLKPDMVDVITSSLMLPLHYTPDRVKAREFISFYEKHHQYYEPRNDVLLKFAKLDFNRVQILHQQEIRSIYKWSNELDLGTKLPLSRDRIMEFFLWSVYTYFEPKYALAREEYSKECYLVTFLDDIYDTYGAFEELPILTNAMDRWERGMIEELPRDYMKHLYKAFLDTFDEFEKCAARDGTSMAVSFTKDYTQQFARAYMLEAEWMKNGYLPSFKESLELAVTTVGKRVVPAATFIGMGELSLQAFQWMQDDPGLAEAVCLVARLVADLTSYKMNREEECGNFINAFSSYKREYKSSDEETATEFRRRASDAWKTINQELMRQAASVPFEILLRALNYARLIEVFYKYEDGITDGKYAESFIKTMFFDPIPL